MKTHARAPLRLVAAAMVAVAWTAAAPRAWADDLPPPQVRPTRARAPQPPTAPRAAPAPTPRTARTFAPPWRSRVAASAPAARPAAAPLARPSAPAPTRCASHSTYVPPVGAAPRTADAARTPQHAPVATTRRGRVPVTTFRIAPAPIPRRVAQPTPPRRRTTWSPRPVPVAPTRSNALPSPSVQKVSPSYEALERTRAHSVTSRARADASHARRRTLQRRGSTRATPRRRAVRTHDLAVPMAPGQSAPCAPSRRTLTLRPPPGCTDDG